VSCNELGFFLNKRYAVLFIEHFNSDLFFFFFRTVQYKTYHLSHLWNCQWI